MKKVLAPVIENSEITPGVFLMWIDQPEIAASANPGQYVMVRCGEDSRTLLRRPLSLHKIDARQDRLALLFSVVGRGTGWLSHRKSGDEIDILGPLGNGFEVHPSSCDLLLVAGGMGIAPLVALADKALAAGHKVTLLQGHATASSLYPERLLPADLNLVVATDDGSCGMKCMVTALLPKFVPGSDQIFSCGPLGMYCAMAGNPSTLGDKPVQVLLETVMGCGVGACLGCTIQTRNGQKQVCKDGPVFELRDVIWDSVPCPARASAIDSRSR